MPTPDFLFWRLDQISYFGIFFSLIIINFTPFPEELLILAIGYLTAFGFGNVFIVAAIGVFSLLVGDNVLFWLSRKGSAYVQRFEEKILQDKFFKFKEKMTKHVGITIFVSRFVSSFRLLGPFLSGSMGVAWKKFQFFDLLALLIYVPVLVFIGREFNNQIGFLIAKVETLRHASFFVFLILLGILSKIFINDKIYKKHINVEK